MKILMVTMALGIGGAETHIVELSRSLAKMGHNVTVASAGGVFVEELLEAGITHVTLPLNSKRPDAVLQSYRGLLSLIREGNFHIVHGHARIPNFILSLVRRRVDFRFVTTAHLDFAVNALWRRITCWGERTLAVSEDIKEYLSREYSTPKENVDVTINGIDMEKFSADTDFSPLLSEFSLDPSHRRVVYISRIDHDRSAVAFMLCAIAPKLAYRYRDLDIVIVGGGDDFDALSAEAEKANAEAGRKIVTLCGARSDINRFCALADVFVAVSRSALEAMSASVPVIVAGNQGYMGIFGEDKLETGRLTNFCCRGCEMPSQDILMRDLCTLLDSDGAVLSSVGEYGRRVVEEYYSADRMARDYLATYEKLPPSTDHRFSDVLFCGYYGYGNTGDELSLRCTVDALRRKDRSLRITVLSAYPKEFGKKLALRAVSRKDPFLILREIRRTRLLVFGGGTLLQDKTSLRSLGYYRWILRTAERRGKSVYVYANGVGPLTKPSSRRAVLRVLNAANRISVREDSAADALIGAGLSPEKVLVSADPAFLIPAPSQKEREELLSELGIEGDYFAVSLRDFPDRDDRFDREISRAVRDISVKYSLIPLFIPMQEGADLALCRRIAADSVGSAVLAKGLTPERTVALLSGARFTVGMRLHSIILSVCVETPVIPLSYDPKVDALCSFLSLPSPENVLTFTAPSLLAKAKTPSLPSTEAILASREKASEEADKILEMTE